MKRFLLSVLLLIFGIQIGFGQLFHVHTHINNNDAKTRAKLAQLIATLGVRNGTLTAINGQLSRALASHQAQLNLQYNIKLPSDRENSVINPTSTLLNLGSSEIASRSLPYMTKEKREYMREVNMDLQLLLALQLISQRRFRNTIKSSKRQEIYRLRSKLLREFAKNGRDARASLFFSAAGLSVLNHDDFLELYNHLKLIQIAM